MIIFFILNISPKSKDSTKFFFFNDIETSIRNRKSFFFYLFHLKKRGNEILNAAHNIFSTTQYTKLFQTLNSKHI